MLANKTFCLRTKVHRTFFLKRGRNRCRSHFFQILDIWSRAEDIRDQSRKLSEIVPKFGRFWPSQILGGGPSENCTHVITLASRHVGWKSIHEDIPTSPEVIGVHTLNFKPNFKFSRLPFWGDPRPTSGVRYQGLGNL